MIQREDLLQKLIHLQSMIYYLDEQLESRWSLQSKDLLSNWNDIYDSLSNFGLTQEKSNHYVAHIKKYQKHELELRSNLLPTRFNMEYFYFYKSCDVKLLRKLIYDYFPKLKKHSSLADWRHFDLVTEINDDVEDIFEDTTTINGNRFLISVIERGSHFTKTSFTNFLNYTKEQSSSRFEHHSNPLKDLIHQKTIENANVTKEMLMNNLNAFRDYDSNKIALFNHMSIKDIHIAN